MNSRQITCFKYFVLAMVCVSLVFVTGLLRSTRETPLEPTIDTATSMPNTPVPSPHLTNKSTFKQTRTPFPILPYEQVLTSYEQRRSWLLNLHPDSYGSNPNFYANWALARLYATGGTDKAALTTIVDSVTKVKDMKDVMFWFQPIARALFMFGDKFSPSQIEHLKEKLLTQSGYTSHGTENHAMMRWSAGYLFAQQFPNETWHSREKVYTSTELKAKIKNILILAGKQYYEKGYSEMGSPTYEAAHLVPLLNLADFADDPEVKAIAEALLYLHLSYIALNNHDGHIIPPYNRQKHQQRQKSTPESVFLSPSQVFIWLYWGQNTVVAKDVLTKGRKPLVVQHALSEWSQNAMMLYPVAVGGGTPYQIRSGIASFKIPWETKSVQSQHKVRRTVYRTPTYAVGSGSLNYAPDGYDMDFSLFNIVWSSTDAFNYIECIHPYWRSNETSSNPAIIPSSRTGVDFWGHGINSPFQQIAQHNNKAIVLFDIPERDPWRDRGNPKRLVTRDLHYDNLVRLGQCRFPESIDELMRIGDWFFLRENDVYIGIKALRPAKLQHSGFTKSNMDDWNVLKSFYARTGFIFEVGTKEEFGDFITFQKRLINNPLSIDWTTMEAKYTGADGIEVKMKFNPDLLEDENGFVRVWPQVWIDENPVDFESWPLIESPKVILSDRTLKIEGYKCITVDWRQTIPTISVTD